MGWLRRAAGRIWRGRRVSGACAVISEWGHPGCQATTDVLARVLHREQLVPVGGPDSEVFEERSAMLFCVYHSPNPGGAPPPELCGGVLANTTTVETWRCTPLVFWACWSANWAGSLGRRDWLGFRKVFGYDFSTARESRWWRRQLEAILAPMARVSHKDVRGEICERCRQARLIAEERFAKSVGSWASVILARGLASVELGDHGDVA